MVLSSSLPGRTNASNILAAASVALALGIPDQRIAEGVSSLRSVPGRFEKIPNALGINVFVDYAHNDGALLNLLESFRELSPPRIILVFGAGGDRDRSKRPRMGEVAGTFSDYAIITSDNPRSEDPLAIIADIEKGMKKVRDNRYEVIPDREQAIRRALKLARPGDYILVAGKGHEEVQIIGDRVFPFRDASVVQNILREMQEGK